MGFLIFPLLYNLPEAKNDPSDSLSDELTVFDEFDSASKMSAAMAAMADDTVAETVYALIGEVPLVLHFMYHY